MLGAFRAIVTPRRRRAHDAVVARQQLIGARDARHSHCGDTDGDVRGGIGVAGAVCVGREARRQRRCRVAESVASPSEVEFG